MKKIFLAIIGIGLNIGSLAQTYNYYAGNLHAHTIYSDGHLDGGPKIKAGTPADAFKSAKDDAEHFDFLGISEHNHKSAKMKLANYALGISEAKKANSTKLACLYGMEYGVIKNGGHALIYGIDQLIGWDQDNFDIECPESDYKALWDIVADYPDAFVTLAHPKANDFSNILHTPYDKKADKAICGVAVMTGPAFSKSVKYDSKPSAKFVEYFQGMLALGYHVGPTVDHDNHYMTYGRMASSRTMILSKNLDVESIMDAYRAMRFYATTDWNMRVSFEVNNRPMGSMINTKKAATLKVTVTDQDANEKISSIKVFYGEPGNKKLPTVLTTGKASTLSYNHDLPAGSEYYYYLEITQTDGDKAYTSPVWIHRLK